VAGATVAVTRSDLGHYIRSAGEEVNAGEVLAVAGTRITPALIGMAAASGRDWLPLHPRPEAAILLFGDELVTEGPAPYGFVRDSLGPAMPAWLAALGPWPGTSCGYQTAFLHMWRRSPVP
jgi:molybdopterin molybdotransferase